MLHDPASYRWPGQKRVPSGVLPLAGNIEGLVISATPVAIHGDRYIDLMLQTPEQEGTDHATRLRVAEHAIAPGTALTPGRRVRVSFLMQQVTGVTQVPVEAE